MPARIVKFESGGYYHVYNRGANREQIFLSPANYSYLIGKMAKQVSKRITMIAYCLMPNHYHFLLRQESDYTISQFMQSLFNVYSKAFNRMHSRTGTLFEGPFKAIEIFEERHLIHLCRYIHRNPLEAGLVNDLRDWPYSNYPEWIGKKNGTLVDRSFIEDYFDSGMEYVKFVLEYLRKKDIEEKLAEILFDRNKS